MAALFCGSSGYLCAIASGTNPAPEEAAEGSGMEEPRMLFDLDEDFSKYPQLNLEHIDE